MPSSPPLCFQSILEKRHLKNSLYILEREDLAEMLIDHEGNTLINSLVQNDKFLIISFPLSLSESQTCI